MSARQHRRGEVRMNNENEHTLALVLGYTAVALLVIEAVAVVHMCLAYLSW